jgi:hypothetical protein
MCYYLRLALSYVELLLAQQPSSLEEQSPESPLLASSLEV